MRRRAKEWIYWFPAMPSMPACCFVSQFNKTVVILLNVLVLEGEFVGFILKDFSSKWDCFTSIFVKHYFSFFLLWLILFCVLCLWDFKNDINHSFLSSPFVFDLGFWVELCGFRFERFAIFSAVIDIFCFTFLEHLIDSSIITENRIFLEGANATFRRRYLDNYIETIRTTNIKSLTINIFPFPKCMYFLWLSTSCVNVTWMKFSQVWSKFHLLIPCQTTLESRNCDFRPQK